MDNLTKVTSSLPQIFNLSYYKMIAPIISTIFFFKTITSITAPYKDLLASFHCRIQPWAEKRGMLYQTHREASLNANDSCSTLRRASSHAFNWWFSYLAPSQSFFFHNNQNTSVVDQATLLSVVSSTATINDRVSISNLGWKSLLAELNVELTFYHRNTPYIELEVVGTQSRRSELEAFLHGSHLAVDLSAS